MRRLNESGRARQNPARRKRRASSSNLLSRHVSAFQPRTRRPFGWAVGALRRYSHFRTSGNSGCVTAICCFSRCAAPNVSLRLPTGYLSIFRERVGGKEPYSSRDRMVKKKKEKKIWNLQRLRGRHTGREHRRERCTIQTDAQHKLWFYKKSQIDDSFFFCRVVCMLHIETAIKCVVNLLRAARWYAEQSAVKLPVVAVACENIFFLVPSLNKCNSAASSTTAERTQEALFKGIKTALTFHCSANVCPWVFGNEWKNTWDSNCCKSFSKNEIKKSTDVASIF